MVDKRVGKIEVRKRGKYKMRLGRGSLRKKDMRIGRNDGVRQNRTKQQGSGMAGPEA